MIVKAGLLLFRDSADGKELLFVRQPDKPFFVFPGGKQDPGETIEQALERELTEELGVGLANIKKIGVVAGQTPDGRDMEMHLYEGVLVGEPVPQAGDIAELAWFGQAGITEHQDRMTPMTLEHVLPFIKQVGLW